MIFPKLCNGTKFDMIPLFRKFIIFHTLIIPKVNIDLFKMAIEEMIMGNDA